MKKSKILQLLLLCCLMGTLNQCRKGEDDPLISTRTRKARVVGEWTVTSGTARFSSGGTNYSSTSNYSFTKISYTESSSTTFNNNVSSSSSNGTFEYKITFERDGTFTMIRMIDGDISTLKGLWNFTGRVGELKNKEQLVLNITSDVNLQASSTITYGGNQTSITYNIKELRNKTMVLVASESSASSGYAESSEEEYVFEQ